MTLSVSLSAQAEAKLKERAATAGKDPAAYASELLEDAVTRPTIDELLAPARRQIADGGMTDAQFDEFLDDLREKVWQDQLYGAGEPASSQSHDPLSSGDHS